MKYPWYIAVTYLIYCLFFGGGLIFGTAYLVFWQGHSGWWFVLSLLLLDGCYKPHRWVALFDPNAAEQQRLAAENNK